MAKSSPFLISLHAGEVQLLHTPAFVRATFVRKPLLVLLFAFFCLPSLYLEALILPGTFSGPALRSMEA